MLAMTYVQVVTTTDSKDAALALARGIVEARLGAAVQLYPIRSVFWWDEAVQDEEEWQLVVKTVRPRVETLIAHIREHHSYIVPEIIVTPIEDGLAEYLSWMDAEARGSSGSAG